jgi:hypothetical protein
MTQRARTRTSKISARLFAAPALALGMACIAHAQTQTFCSDYPCYHVFVDTTDGGGLVSQFSPNPPFSLSQTGFFNGNQEAAYAIANLGSVGSATSVVLVTCPINCLVLVQANAGGQYFDAFDLRGQGVAAGQMLQFDLSLSGTFGSGPPLATVNAGLELINGNNVGEAGLGGTNFFPPQSSSTTATVVVGDLTVDPFLTLVLEVDTSTALSPSLSNFGSNFADFSTTFIITGVELLDPSGNFLRNIVLTDTAGFTLPGPGPGPGTAPEPATLLLVVSALAVLGINAGRKRHGSGG